jgi:hypothetical protein
VQVVRDYYAILQVSPDAEREVIDAAYRRLARKYHPDVYTEGDAAERMRQLNEAYEILGDPGKRAEYDRGRHRGAGEPGRGQRTASRSAPEQRPTPPQRVQTPDILRRRRRMLLAGLAVFVLAVVVAGATIGIVVALSGGEETPEVVSPLVPSPGAAGTAIPTAIPTATPSAVEQQLEGMVLQLSDLPAGFSLAQESSSTNEEVAGEGEDAAEVLASLTEWGRVLGHGVVFSSEGSGGGGVLLVDSTVSLYETDSGATASFADAVTTARTTDWQAGVSGASDVQAEELPPLDVADEMLWLRVTGTAVIGDPPTEEPFTQDVVLLRVGRARGSVSTLSTAADAAPLVESMVRAQAANMAEGLR